MEGGHTKLHIRIIIVMWIRDFDCWLKDQPLKEAITVGWKLAGRLAKLLQFQCFGYKTR